MPSETRAPYAQFSWSPWIGCTELSAGCDNCIVKQEWQDAWQRVKFGAGQHRLQVSRPQWGKPKEWDKLAKKQGIRFVITVSLCDVFDAEVPEWMRDSFWSAVRFTPHLDWAVTTKRIENVKAMLPWGANEKPWPNLWLGVSCEHQLCADARIDLLQQCNAGIIYAEFAPLLEEIKFKSEWGISSPGRRALDWVTISGEIGDKARKCDLRWIKNLQAGAQAFAIPVFAGHTGANAVESLPGGAFERPIAAGDLDNDVQFERAYPLPIP